MSNISFSDLRTCILKSCSTDIEDNNLYAFKVDMKKLDNILKTHSSTLFTLGFNTIIESRVPDFKDIQLISEYTRDEKEITNTFNGKVQVCEFMVFLKENIDGPIDINYGEDNKVLSDEELFNLCNVDLNKDMILEIIKNLPVYKILVVKEFNKNIDNFRYNIFIRSNYQMVSYYKQLTGESDGEEKKKNYKKK